MGLRVAVAAMALVLAGCAGQVTLAPAPEATPAAIPSAPGSADAAPSSAATALPSAAPSVELMALQELLPADFGGVEAHTFAVGQDMLERLAAELGVAGDDIQVAFASDHGPAFIQMIAIRVAGHPAAEVADALRSTAYPAEAQPQVGSLTLAGRELTVVDDEELGPQRGTFYILPLPEQDAVIVSQAFAEPVVEAALNELP